MAIDTQNKLTNAQDPEINLPVLFRTHDANEKEDWAEIHQLQQQFDDTFKRLQQKRNLFKLKWGSDPVEELKKIQ